MLGTVSPSRDSNEVGMTNGRTGAGPGAGQGDVTADLGGFGALFGSQSHQHQHPQAHGHGGHGGHIGFSVPPGLQAQSGLSLGTTVDDPSAQAHAHDHGHGHFDPPNNNNAVAGMDMGLNDPGGVIDSAARWNEEEFRRQHPDLFQPYGEVQGLQAPAPTQTQGRLGATGQEDVSMLPSKKRRFRANTASDSGATETIGSKTKASSGSGTTTTGATVSDPRSFVINTGMHNESDALQILAMAATSTKKKQDRPGKRSRSHSVSSHAESSVVAYRRSGGAGERKGRERSKDGESRPARSSEGSRRRTEVQQQVEDEDEVGDGEGLSTRGGSAAPLSPSPEADWQVGGTTIRVPGPSWNHGRRTGGKVSFDASGDRSNKAQAKVAVAKPTLSTFPLVAKGIMDPEQVCHFGDMFFSKHHYVFVSVGALTLSSPARGDYMV